MSSVSTVDQRKNSKIRHLDHPPYQIVGDVKPFPQNMTVFSRVRWDPTCVGHGESRSKSTAEIIEEGKPDYSRVSFSLQAAAWSIVSIMGKQAYSAEKIGARSSNIRARYEPEDAGEFTNQVKTAARLYGANIVGITRLDRRWLYAKPEGELVDITDDVNMAIIMGVEMDGDLIKHSPSPLASAAVGNGYSRMVFTTACLAEFLRDLGWQAIGSGNDTALSIPLAMDAGLGECGRNGMLITPEFGARQRLCKVFTDAPLVPDRPIEFGVVDFCEKCGKCAKACPVEAITAGERTPEALTPSNSPGVLKWPVNGEKCLRFWRTNGTSCCNCISSCPMS
ncbi:reductive dehalogenase [Candidatus Poribacteria bacterium]